MKKQTITLRGPFTAHPTVTAMQYLGYTEFVAPPLEVYRVDKTMNTLVVLPGHLVGVEQVNALLVDELLDVNVLTPKDGEGAYVDTAERWLELGGSKAV